MNLSTHETGFVLASPVLTIAGLFFAVAISASAFHALFGKAIGWPLSIMLGYQGGVHWGEMFFPSWPEAVSAALMFGPGFFGTWCVIGIVFQEEMLLSLKNISSFVGKRLFAAYQARRGSSRRGRYKAVASSTRSGRRE